MGQQLKGKLLNPANNFNNPQEATLFRKSMGLYLNLFDFGIPPNLDPSSNNTPTQAIFTTTPLFIPHWVTKGAPGVSNWNFSVQLSVSTNGGSSAFTIQPALAIMPTSVLDDIDETQGAKMTTYNPSGTPDFITDDFGASQVAPSSDVSFFFSGINVGGPGLGAALNHPFLFGIYNNNGTGAGGDVLNIDRCRLFIKFPSLSQ